jgi:hypothetical protein
MSDGSLNPSMISRMRIANFILLTAAVTPDPRFGSTVAHPGERLEEYRTAIRRWSTVADGAGFEMAVVETTGSRALANDVKVIDFTPTDAQAARGKGAVEAAALEHALVALEPRRESTIVKVTGRLVIENAHRLVVPIAENVAVVRRTLDRRYCDSRFFLTTAGFWTDHLADMGRDVDDSAGRYLEHSLAHRLIRSEFLDQTRVEQFPIRPLFSGRSGTNGNRYGTVRDRLSSPLMGAAEHALAHRLGSKQV